MKLFFKSYKIYLIFFILIACESSFTWGIAQDRSLYPHPWIQEINLPDHLADIPNASFYLDQQENLFLGKDNGLSIIRGVNYQQIDMKGPVFISGNGSDTIFYACKNDMGFLLKDKSGSFTTHSQKDRISRANRIFTPSGLIYKDEAVFLNTERGIYNYRKGRFTYHLNSGDQGKLHIHNGHLLFKTKQAETQVWTGKDFQKLNSQKLARYPSLQIPEEPEAQKAYQFFDYISDNEIIVTSRKQGLMILDLSGKILTTLGTRSGLPNQDIRQVCMCEEDELWILGAYSLHKISHPSAMRILELKQEDIGKIYASEVGPHGVILGTSQGLFIGEASEETKGQWRIESITGEEPESFRLMSRAGNRVFAAGSKHLTSFSEGNLEIVSSGTHTGLQAINQDLVVASGEKGLLSFRKDPAGWVTTTLDPALTNSFSFVNYKNKIFFLSNNEVHRLSEGKGIRLPFHREDLLQKLVNVDEQLYLITSVQVYRYEENEESFLPVEKDHHARLLSASDIIIPDENGGHWTVRHQGEYNSRVLHQLPWSEAETENLAYPVLQNLGEIVSINIRDSVLFLTGEEKLIMFDLHLLNHATASFAPRIEAVNAPQQNRSIVFHINGLQFQSIPKPEFRFRLISQKEEWSEWSTANKIIFNHLKPGNYNLQAQAKDLYGRISSPSEIQFLVKAPFYGSWYAYVAYGILFLILLFLIRKLSLLNYRHAESRVSLRMQSKLDDLTQEKEKSDRLVADILPDRTAQQIKSVGKAKWDKYERATVLFSDIQGFTKIAEEMNPETLIDELDQFFFHFDSVVDKYNIEKIKTIGDAYMAAGGIPEKNSTNPVEVVLAALEMQSYMKQLKSSKADIWDLRIGVHTGPVIAGVVGHKKVSYDIWGDTVNTASRMESSGVPGKVNISGITYGMVKDYFICEYRGKLPVKYKGNIDMYFVNGLRPELAVDLKGIPNKRFFTKLQILRLGDLEDRVFESILPNLPDNLHFHRKEYARKIYDQAFLLCRAEEVEQEDRLLIRTAALMLFTGLTQAYANYENRSSVISREILPEFSYSESQVDKICNLILATKAPFQPNNQLEKILIDTKMEYIGRPEYPAQIKLLHKEMIESGVNLNGQQFKKQQLELLYTYDFFTVAARRLREVSGEEQRTSLEQERWI